MKLLHVKEGMKVRIAGDLKQSDSECGGCDSMFLMKKESRICTVINKDSRYVYLSDEKYGTWWFHPDDLTPMMTDKEYEQNLKEKEKLLLFNENNIW